MEGKSAGKKVYQNPSKKLFIGKRSQNVRKIQGEEESVMVLGSKKKAVSGMGRLAALVKYFFSNAGLIYGCIIFASVGKF